MRLSKKELIFQTAAKMFVENGFKASSIRDLATKVKLEPSSIYSHVKSKEELLYIICLRSANKFVDFIKEVDEKYDVAQDKIEDLITFHIDVAMNDPISTIVFSDEWRNLKESSLKEFVSLRKEYESFFMTIISNGKEDKYIREIDDYVVMRTIVSGVSWVQDQKKYKTEKSKGLLAKQLKEFIQSGILA